LKTVDIELVQRRAVGKMQVNLSELMQSETLEIEEETVSID
jgi:hypothetical protein